MMAEIDNHHRTHPADGRSPTPADAGPATTDASHIVTFDGHIGSGALDVGRKVANLFRLQFFNQVALPDVHQLAERPGVRAGDASAAEAVYEERDVSFYDRVWRWIETASSLFALGAEGDPLLPSAVGVPLTWDTNGPRASAGARHLWTLDEIASRGDAVVVHRAGSVILPSAPEITKVGLFAEWDDRVARLMQREGITRIQDAEKLLVRRQDAQRSYYADAHRADPEDHGLYDLVLNTSETRLEMATMIVTRRMESAAAAAAA